MVSPDKVIEAKWNQPTKLWEEEELQERLDKLKVINEPFKVEDLELDRRYLLFPDYALIVILRYQSPNFILFKNGLFPFPEESRFSTSSIDEKGTVSIEKTILELWVHPSDHYLEEFGSLCAQFMCRLQFGNGFEAAGNMNADDLGILRNFHYQQGKTSLYVPNIPTLLAPTTLRAHHY